MSSIFRNFLAIGLVAVGVGGASLLFPKPASAEIFFRAPFVHVGYRPVYRPYFALTPGPVYRSHEIWVPCHYQPGHRNIFGEFIPGHYVPGHYV